MLKYSRVNILKRLLNIFKKEKIIVGKNKVFIVILLMTISTVLGAVSPYLYSLFIDEVMMKKDIVLLPSIILLMLVCYLIRALCEGFNSLAVFQFAEKFRNGIKMCLLKNVLEQRLSETKNSDVGKIQKIIDQDSATVVNFVSTHIIKFLCHAGFILIYLSLMCKTCLILTFVTLTVYPIVYIGVRYTGKRFNKIKNDLWNINASNNTFLFEIIGKWKEVKSNCLEQNSIDQYKRALVPEKKINLKWMLCFSINSMMYAIKNELFQKIFIYFLGGYLIMNDKITIGYLLMFLSYLSSFNVYVDSIMQSISGLIGDQAAFERIFSVFSEKNKYDCEKEKEISKSDEIFLSIKGVDYSYKNSLEIVFKDANCDFIKGKKYLVTGKSGIGKSTLVRLLEKSISPINGQILLNGHNINLYDEYDFYNLFGFVLQDNEFFNFSIEENLKVFNSNVSRDELISACSIAGIHDFIESLPNGYNTLIGERGVKLSGGQKQKLAIARMILHKPKIIVFDEATCSIDKATEANIFKELEIIFGNCLWIVITHDVEIPIHFDYIVNVNNRNLCVESNNIMNKYYIKHGGMPNEKICDNCL